MLATLVVPTPIGECNVNQHVCLLYADFDLQENHTLGPTVAMRSTINCVSCLNPHVG